MTSLRKNICQAVMLGMIVRFWPSEEREKEYQAAVLAKGRGGQRVSTL
jgi:hypothetical protein